MLSMAAGNTAEEATDGTGRMGIFMKNLEKKGGGGRGESPYDT